MRGSATGGVECAQEQLWRFKPYDCWLAYLDILGFGALVAEAARRGTENAQIAQLRQILDSALPRADMTFPAHGDLPPVTRSGRIFSDLIVVWEPVWGTSDWTWQLGEFLSFAARVVLEVSLRGIFVRGAVVRGAHYDDGLLTFSPALIQAHQMERHEAFYPRVIIHRDVVAAHGESRRREDEDTVGGTTHYDRLLYRDDDGRVFLNYLECCRLKREDDLAPLSALRLHRDQVRAKLRRYRRDPRVQAKYGWVAHYHNRFCGTDVDADIDRAPLLVPWPERSEGCREPRP